MLPFTLIYLHNERGIGLGTAGLVWRRTPPSASSRGRSPAPSSTASAASGCSTIALGFLTLGIAGYAFVETAWQGFLAAAVVGIGNGAFWPSQSSLLSGLVTARAAADGVRDAARDDEPRDRHRRPRRRLHRRRELPARSSSSTRSRSSRYAAVLWVVRSGAAARGRASSALGQLSRRASVTSVFMGLMARQRALHRRRDRPARGAARVREERGRHRREPESASSSSSTRSSSCSCSCRSHGSARGHRRMPFLALVGVVCAASWLLVPVQRAVAVRARRLRRARGRGRALRRRRVPARRGAGAARRRSRRPPHDRALHGGLGALLAGRVHDRPGRGRRAARRLADRALDRGRDSSACSRAEQRSCSSAGCPRASAGRRASRRRPVLRSPIVDAALARVRLAG